MSRGSAKTVVAALIAAAVIVVGAVGCSERESQVDAADGGEVSGPVAATQPVAVPSDPEQLRQLATGVTTGDPNAPVTIMEFADYSCPHCRAFEQEVKPRIDLTYIQTGKAKFVFHDFVLGGFPHSFLAARAARCAGDQQKYMEYHDALFANQPEWSTVRLSPIARLVEYAEGLGLNRETFETCLRSDKYADVVSANRELAVQLNLRGTPSVLVSTAGTLPRPVDHPDIWVGISERVDSILKAAPAKPAP